MVFVEIRADSVLQVFGFTHIDNGARFIQILIASGRIGQVVDNSFQVVKNIVIHGIKNSL
jgi:hypothetical protein